MVPVTFHYDWEFIGDHDRQTLMYEFAANGAKHLVLTDTLIHMIGRTSGLYRQLRREVAAAGLDFVDSHAPFRGDTDPNCPDPAARPYMLAQMRLTLQIVHDFGVKTCCFHISNCVYPGYGVEAHREATWRTIDEILPLAERLDVVLCFENTYRPFNTVDEIRGCLDRYPSKYLGMCYDSGHANIMEHGMAIPECVLHRAYTDCGLVPRGEEDVLGAMLPRLVSCHLHDNDIVSDQHVLPGLGTIDWSALVPKLLSAPRLACIQSEVVPRRVQQPIRPLCEKFAELFGEL